MQKLLQKLIAFVSKTLATIQTVFSVHQATDVYFKSMAVSHDTSTGTYTAAGQCQIWEAPDKEGTKVAPEFVFKPSPLSNVALGAVSQTHQAVQLR